MLNKINLFLILISSIDFHIYFYNSATDRIFYFKKIFVTSKIKESQSLNEAESYTMNNTIGVQLDFNIYGLHVDSYNAE